MCIREIGSSCYKYTEDRASLYRRDTGYLIGEIGVRWYTYKEDRG